MATETRLLVDTNVILDYCDPNRPCHGAAVSLVENVASNPHAKLLVLVSSLKDVYYILRHLYMDEPKARQAVRMLSSQVFEPVDLLVAYSSLSLESNEPDYEDGLVRAAAELLHVQGIVTRDAKAFALSTVPSMDAEQALLVVGSSH